MKNLFINILFVNLILLVSASGYAQDTTTSSASKQISKTSEQADNLFGKKIQQQSLSIRPNENLNSSVLNNSKKTCAKHKRKHH